MWEQYNNNIKDSIPNEMNLLISNPLAYLAKRNLNLPQGFQGGPREIVQYLLDTGQMSQKDFDGISRFVSKIKPLN